MRFFAVLAVIAGLAAALPEPIAAPVAGPFKVSEHAALDKRGCNIASHTVASKLDATALFIAALPTATPPMPAIPVLWQAMETLALVDPSIK
ncbi:hypothetical protein B0T14DRAFT_564097 [Immersiella caudata]|uniref:Uncharacterized protein n=1 Tax=Immersiella caudata TaxID=314043 RepID=A0AA39WW30_9PEZI|nr:hypothetical protein B0T14DRAFT_564097 [Immersiella caudata]